MENTIDNIFAGEILRLTAQLVDRVGNNEKYTSSTAERMKQVYEFCGAIPRSAGWLDAVSSAVVLARGDYWMRADLSARFRPEANHAEWVHAALNHVEQFPGLLQALVFDREALPVSPPKATLRVILWALSTPGNIAEIAFDLLRGAPAWFQDAELQVMMQQSSVWQLLGRVASRESVEWWFRPAYFHLGATLANTAQWEPIVRDDLAGWITAFLQDERPETEKFTSVLSRVWLRSGDNDVDQTRRPEAITLMFRALTKAWDEFNLIHPRDWSDFCRLAKCTALAALRTHYYVSGEAISIPSDFRVSFSAKLRDSLIQAAEKARVEVNSSQRLEEWEHDGALTEAAKILEQIGTHIPCNVSGADFTDPELVAIQDRINASIDAWEERFAENSLVQESEIE
ncbi:hypothetical protein DFH09DRAFT_1128986 [Mycena vulgaris]|nr:hypothetical protein DFH09DRAFT_1128986 [Mycena vulgaris]